ncbi:MAG TPA: 4-coumarate--CoA ligase family protein [Pyrinomonadaceae bacterium]|nr:4-coumarate--CoA ligase family protein [Pyrinomonadaceae bacterium]
MIFRSPLAEIAIPEVSLTALILERARRYGDKPALIEGMSGRTLTYGELVEKIERAAASLHRRGFGKGDCLAIFSPNVPEYAIAFHAASHLGGAVTTINPLYTAEEVAHQLKDANAKFMVTVPALLDKAREAAGETKVEEIFVFGEAEGAAAFDSLFETEDRVPPAPVNPREDVCALPFSSGTTGLPKGVMLTHHNLVSNMCQMEQMKLFDERDNLICVLPLFHIYGLMVILNLGLYKGTTIVTMPRFELEEFLRLMQDYRVSFAHVVPPIILALAKHPAVDTYDLSKLRTVFSGAAPLGEDLTRACIERLSCQVRQGYGMTETSPATHCTGSDTAGMKHGSVGMCVPNTEARLVDVETGETVGQGKRGELWVRGPQVMKGYHNRADATSATLDDEGWLHTGDVGYVDEEGHLFIVDRVKELIKYKGFQVAPAELEAILLTHPAVADAAVIPSPDEEAGEVPKAFVVLKAEVSPEEIKEFVAERVAPHKKIRRLEIIDQIPKTASGKILRRVLKERERAQVSETN